MANISDKFTRASTVDQAEYPTLTAQKNIGDASLTASSLNNWPTSTAVHFILYQVDINGNQVVGTQSEWKGVVSGATSIINLTLYAGTDQIYPIGCILQVVPTSGWANDLVEGLNVSHELNGTLKDNIIVESKIAAAAVSNAKLAATITDTTNAGPGGGSAHYCRIGPLLYQWGETAQSPSIPSGGSVARGVTFPIAFSAVPTVVTSISNNTTEQDLIALQTASPTTTAAAITITNQTTGGGAGTARAQWVAIGPA
jgi:hypothetical protein